jgi:MFS family permease
LSILGRLGFGWLGDQYNKKNMMAAALGFMTIGMTALYFSHNPWFIIIFLIFFSPGFGGNTTLRGSIIREYFGTRAFGRLLGVTMGVSSVGGIAGPVLAGWTFDRMGTYTPIWLVFTVLTVVAAMLIFSVSSPREVRIPT